MHERGEGGEAAATDGLAALLLLCNDAQLRNHGSTKEMIDYTPRAWNFLNEKKMTIWDFFTYW